MFKVEYCHPGAGLWNRGALPVSLQAAVGLARAVSDDPLVKDVRIVPAVGVGQVDTPLLDLLV